MARLARPTGFRMPIICIFPGQGSQARGMGADLFERYADWTSEADEILGYSIRELCTTDPRGQLGLTEFTQPALFVVNALTYRARQDGGPPPPAALAGHSLGEYNALHAAGVFDFATGLRLVQQRGRIMGKVTGGGMAAVIGLEPSRIRQVLDLSDAGRRLDVANFNSFDQTVLAGPRDDLAAVKPDFDAAGARACIPLNVSAPFHSRYMKTPAAEFRTFLDGFALAPPSIPVISNVTARPYEASAVRETLADQIANSVRWLDSVLYLFEHVGREFEEVGPGSVLTKLVAQIAKRARG
jgi:trans-AT polyketide synthase/acyltransferase/oxidoreductase domain-containing protein